MVVAQAPGGAHDRRGLGQTAANHRSGVRGSRRGRRHLCCVPYFSSDVTCQKLRNNIIAIMERSVPAETKRSLLKKGVAEFDKFCGEADPDARIIFQAAMAEHPAEAAHAPAEAGASSQQPQWASLGVFGAPGSKEQPLPALVPKADR